MAAKTTRTERAQLSPQKASGQAALELIFAPITKRREGFRHGCLGAPGFGKTYAMNYVVKAALERGLVDVVLTHDIKGREPEFEGLYLATVDDLRTIVDDGGADSPELEHIVFRGDPRAGVECDPETVAALALRLARDEQPQRVLFNVNEIDECLTDGGRGWRSPSTRTVITQGRALEVSFCWTTQQPQRVPNEPMDQSTTIAFFHLDARATNYLGGTLMLDDEMVAIMPKLDVGEFVLKVPGLEWDGKIYKF